MFCENVAFDYSLCGFPEENRKEKTSEFQGMKEKKDSPVSVNILGLVEP